MPLKLDLETNTYMSKEKNQCQQSRQQIKGNPQKEIISKKCLISVLECIEYLKDNTEQFGLFYQLGSRTRARDILSRIERGDQDILQSLRTHGGPLEVASALKTFLVGLRAPLMPARVQELIVADNAGVSTRTVALDALGLLSQETPSSRQRTLLLSLLGLLQKISNNANSNNTLGELEGSHAALVMLPVFFNFTVDVLPHWRRIAAVFNELLICVPGLDDPENSDSIIRTLAERPSGDLSIDIQPIPDPLVRVQDQYRQLRQNQQNNNAIISMGTTSRRCSGWVRLSISDPKQQNNENSKNKPTDPNNKENEGSKPTGSTNTGSSQGNTPNKTNANHNGPQSIAIIDVPINCPEGFRPDPRGICRESF
ncbi:uncharacterized protein LOC113385836 [Ctenocephalides felis]|uniref:uncharacterized protein LOC113385836 n=1 Tax=Ctenocephalides felis TaxID=7515 RepID=UPI000E6E14EE|nr:uncharacterized protein LOC113385836 [Ctenocephalides felis]